MPTLHMKRFYSAISGCLFFILGALAFAQGVSIYGPGADQHWRVRSGSGRSGEPIRSGTPYRLVTAGGQLVGNSKVREGFRIVPTREAGENFHIRTRASDDGGVKLNEPVALYHYGAGYFIVHKKGGADSLGWALWDPSREPRMEMPKGVYQWELRSSPDSRSRDHRSRPAITLEVLGLFNTSANAYLVSDRKTQELRWRQ